MSVVTDRLDDAKRSLAAGDVQAAVTALVLAWGKHPSTRIGDLAIRLSATLPPRELPVKVSDRERIWFDLAQTPAPEVVHQLLAIPWPVHPRGVKLRLDRLVTFPPDPRIAASLRDLWHSGAYQSMPGGTFWRRAFRMLLNWKDPGTVAIISLAKRDDRYGILQSVVDRRTKTPLPQEPELAEEETKRITEIESIAGTRTAQASKDQLLEAVYAHPDDDGPRLVLADLLVADNDPRGEFIQIQNALDQGRGAKGKLGKRAEALLHAYGRKWLDGLDAMVNAQAIFRCGFASDVTLERAPDPSVRAWRTVGTVLFNELDELHGVVKALSHENLAHVTNLVGISTQTLAGLVDACGARQFGLIDARGALTNVATCEAHIRHLSVRGRRVGSWGAAQRLAYAEVFAWFENSPLKGRVDVLELDGVESVLEQALQGMARNPTLAGLWLRPTSSAVIAGERQPVFWDIRISRDATEAPTVLDATWTGVSTSGGVQGTHDGFALALASLHDDALTRLTVSNTKPVKESLQATRDAALVSAVRKQRRLTTLTLSGKDLALTAVH